MLALALMGPWRMMPLKVPHDVRWEPNHPWACQWSYETLRAAEWRKRRYELVFPTTTSFKVDGEPTALPTPRLLLASALQRWNRHAPFQLAPELANLIDPLLRVEAAEVRPSRVRAGDKWVRGFTGQMNVTVSRRASPELAQVAHCLLMYLTLSGAGVKTAMGLGTVVPPLPQRTPRAFPPPARWQRPVAPEDDLFHVEEASDWLFATP
jgi:CRISPR/Cas system endoribonuclease Cas6 (RAMP superfamily)